MPYVDNANRSVVQRLPVDEMPPEAEDIAVHAELRRNRSRDDRAGCDAVEGFEQSRDVGVRLGSSPVLATVLVYFLDAESCGVLNAHGHHAPGRALFLAITSSADSGW